MKIAFRVDASTQIGTGHVMRCLTLAKAVRERGAECLFISRDHEHNLNALLQAQGFMVHEIFSKEDDQDRYDQSLIAHAHWLGTSWFVDANQTIEVLGDSKIDWLIVDHYALDKRWESQLRPYTKKIMVIDDLADRAHDCDLLLDQNLVANFETRYDQLAAPDCTRLLGPRYALLQPEYSELRLLVTPRTGLVRRIFVYFGGSDLFNLTGITINAFLKLNTKELQLDIVINPNSSNATIVRALAAGHLNITIHETGMSLAPLIARADLAIGAAGATTWERCCLGLPAFVVTVAENQRPIATELDRIGIIRYIGHYDKISVDQFMDLMQFGFNQDDFTKWSTRCMAVVDGGGLSRVLRELSDKTGDVLCH